MREVFRELASAILAIIAHNLSEWIRNSDSIKVERSDENE